MFSGCGGSDGTNHDPSPGSPHQKPSKIEDMYLNSMGEFPIHEHAKDCGIILITT